MRVSLRWLKNYVRIRTAPDELAAKLTMAGLEVESVESQADELEGIVVAEVRTVEPHPNASRLTVCNVFDGSGEIRVVCGAPNVAAGQKIAFAREGSLVPRNQHDPAGGKLRIGRVAIRGVESAGMICSGYELGLSDDREGILVLDAAAKPGVPLSSHLGRDDTIFEIGVTANRPDLLSHVGVAREIASLSGQPLKLPRVTLSEGKRSCRGALQVRVLDPVNCPRYSARVIEGIRVGPSPSWMQDALSAVGIRPVNNVVDVTNYVLMEIGQPLHAFDYHKIAGKSIIVRGGEAGQRFETLDLKQREVREDTLLICDADGPVAIGGVMGGRNSEISDRTTSVVIESAYFNPASIRRTSKRLGLSTEASQRFERGADPNITTWALDRATGLLSTLAGGTVLRGRIDAYPRRIREKRIRYDAAKSDQLLGITISREKVSGLFRSIGIRRTGSSGARSDTYIVPTWRPDLTRAIDLVEEAARLYGYDRIGTSARMSLALAETQHRPDLAEYLGEYLSSAGFREVVTNSMSDRETAASSGLPPVVISNPISREMEALRTSLLPGILTVIKHNLFHGARSSRFYEIGSVFTRIEGGDAESLSGYREEERLIAAVYGLESPVSWENKPRMSDIFTLKGEAKALLGKISLDNPRYIPYSNSTALSERSISIEIKGENVGTIGSVSAGLLGRYDIDTEVHYFELSLDAMRKVWDRMPAFRPYARFPVVRRDIAVIVDESVPVGGIEEIIRDAAGRMLGDVTLFDVFRGDQAGAGKKSCAFSLEFVPTAGTLGQDEILGLMEAVTLKLKTSLGAELRQ